ncbi:pseudouridine synthase [Fragilariopsis cylindrus CCMP1102]|uniref:Pseudouridine synthase n=1 Tax=Fragilariopsis cylindrus CCMP1102 TaxID=635003 RepID=A0A1E7F500_9STRA|nr:pseudouridine synthase [Fragilariopsis cylindrus CCMP1102]|eukprot:OEU13219.1 pseudouridine synthase [Fragilariopsis cylindrus CCMP1102]
MRFFAVAPAPVLASLCIYIGCSWCFCFAFSPCFPLIHSDNNKRRLFHDSQHRIVLCAKPSPTSIFDLASIEAVEAAMDLGEDINLISSDNNDVSISDGESVDDDDDDENTHMLSVPDNLDGKRIDAVLAALMDPPMSRSASGNLVTNECVYQIVTTKEGSQDTVLIDRKSIKVDAGATLRVVLPKNEIPTEIIPQNIPLKILYEDEYMIVINKDAGMVVHPAAGNWEGTVVNALAYYLANDSPYGIVHRLDKGTTGILVVSKTDEALANLSAAFAARKVKKTYLAITVGNPGKHVVIDKPIGRHPLHRQRMRVVPDPHRKNSSGVTPRERIRIKKMQMTLAKVRIETGRTHQIRVHLQDRHTPVYGDDVYGIADWNKRLLKNHGIQRPLLHAHTLEIEHPITGEHMVFVAPMAADMITIAESVWPDGPNEIPEAYQTLV